MLVRVQFLFLVCSYKLWIFFISLLGLCHIFHSVFRTKSLTLVIASHACLAAMVGSHVWRTALASPPMTSGVHRWEVVIDRCSGNGNVMIGVTENTQMLTGNYIGQSVGVGYYGASGYDSLPLSSLRSDKNYEMSHNSVIVFPFL